MVGTGDGGFVSNPIATTVSEVLAIVAHGRPVKVTRAFI